MLRMDHVFCACCGGEFEMPLVGLSRHRGPLRCPGCESELAELRYRKQVAEKDERTEAACNAAVARIRGAPRSRKR